MSVIDWVRALWRANRLAGDPNQRAYEDDGLTHSRRWLRENPEPKSSALAGAAMTAEDVARVAEAKRKARDIQRDMEHQQAREMARRAAEAQAAQTITVTISVPPGSSVSVTKN